jgi:predicted glycoside hydrolase/deacetylase ChbG (UPF0249 family)
LVPFPALSPPPSALGYCFVQSNNEERMQKAITKSGRPRTHTQTHTHTHTHTTVRKIVFPLMATGRWTECLKGLGRARIKGKPGLQLRAKQSDTKPGLFIECVDMSEAASARVCARERL